LWAETLRKILPLVTCSGDVIAGYANIQADRIFNHFFVAGTLAGQHAGSLQMDFLHRQDGAFGITGITVYVSKTAETFFVHRRCPVEKWLSSRCHGLTR